MTAPEVAQSCGWCGRTIPASAELCAPCTSYLAPPTHDELDHRAHLRPWYPQLPPRRLTPLHELTRRSFGGEHLALLRLIVETQVDACETIAAEWADEFNLGHGYVGAARGRCRALCDELINADMHRWADTARQRNTRHATTPKEQTR